MTKADVISLYSPPRFGILDVNNAGELKFCWPVVTVGVLTAYFLFHIEVDDHEGPAFSQCCYHAGLTLPVEYIPRPSNLRGEVEACVSIFSVDGPMRVRTDTDEYVDLSEAVSRAFEVIGSYSCGVLCTPWVLILLASGQRKVAVCAQTNNNGVLTSDTKVSNFYGRNVPGILSYIRDANVKGLLASWCDRQMTDYGNQADLDPEILREMTAIHSIEEEDEDDDLDDYGYCPLTAIVVEMPLGVTGK
jgi:hypothetical protein